MISLTITSANRDRAIAAVGEMLTLLSVHHEHENCITEDALFVDFAVPCRIKCSCGVSAWLNPDTYAVTTSISSITLRTATPAKRELLIF